MDIGIIKHILNSRVYVDQKVKDALIEFFSIQNLKKNSDRNPIVCLLGPPGMGKRTIIQSLCSMLAWNLIRIPIGATKGENGGLWGNRRSDLNAIAGRIVHALNDRPSSETVVALEQLHQLDSSQLSNPSVDFFEVLNYVQDYAIKNNYQKVPIDFSHVFFFATAQNLSPIPPGLLEQMEVIPIPAYTEREKIRIAENFILPELMHAYGLEKNLVISKNALVRIVKDYTREAGVAELQKNLKDLCKAAARRLNENKITHGIRIYKHNVANHLGPPRFVSDRNYGNNAVGVIKVLGRSTKGGCTVILEALALKGEGKVVITGNTDKIFQESVMVAVAYVRSCAPEFGIAQDFYKQYDLHLHMMEGLTPKYGVSAGMAIVTALVSALSGKPVKGNVGMTGEISLYGRILGVRDIRDKVLGAYQAGIKTIFLPRENERDLQDIPEETKREMHICLVENVTTAVKEALVWQ